MAYADSGPSRPGSGPSSLPFKPSGDRRWDYERDRDRSFSREPPRDSAPGRGYYPPSRRDYPPPRINSSRSRTPSPPRRYSERGYDGRALDDQWRGPPPAGRPSGRDRDWERDRDWRRNDRFRDEPRSTPGSIGHSPPDRTPRSPPFPPRNSRFSAARTPPLSGPRVPSGPRAAIVPSVPSPKEDSSRDTPREFDSATPGPGPSTLAHSTPTSAPRAPRSMRGSSSPLETKRLRLSDTSPSVPSPSDSGKDGQDADSEEGEVVSPVKSLVAPWVEREARRGGKPRDWDYNRSRDRTWDWERERAYGREREDDRWESNRSYRPPMRNSMSPPKRRSRSPYQPPPPRRAEDWSAPVQSSLPPARVPSADGRAMSNGQEDARPRRPPTPDGPPPDDDVKPEFSGDASRTNIEISPPKRPQTPLEPPPPTDQVSPEDTVDAGGIIVEDHVDAPSAPQGHVDQPMPEAAVAQPEVASETIAEPDSTVAPQPSAASQSSIEPQQSVEPQPTVELQANDEPQPNEEPPIVDRTAKGPEDIKQPVPSPTLVREAAPLVEQPAALTSESAPVPSLREDEHAAEKVAESTSTETVAETIPPVALVSQELAEPKRPTPEETNTVQNVATESAEIENSVKVDTAEPLTVVPEAPPQKPISNGRSRAPPKTVPVEASPRATIAERRAVQLPSSKTPIPSRNKSIRRDSIPTATSVDVEMANGSKGKNDMTQEDEQLARLVGAVKAAQRKPTKPPVIERPTSPTGETRVDPTLTDAKQRDARIEQFTWPLTTEQAAVRPSVHLTIQREKAMTKEKIETLRLEYQELDAEWKIHCDYLDALMEKRGPPPADLYAVANPLPLVTPGAVGPLPTTPVEDAFAARTRRRNLGDAVATEADFEAILAEFADTAAKDPNLRASKTTAVVPDMLSDDERRMSYDDDNDLVTDPLSFYDFAGQAEPIWTEEERTVFLRRYLSYPKQFGKIAEALEHKTAAQCVAFYYRTKKTVDYKGMLASRRGDKKKKAVPIKKNGKSSASLADLDKKKPTIDSGSTPGPRSAITPARKGDESVGRRGRQSKDSGASTPVAETVPRRKKSEDEDASSAGPSRAGSETPSVAKARMRLPVRGPKRPRVSSVTETPASATIPSETVAETEAADTGPAPPPAELLPPVKRAIKRRKVDPNDPNATAEDKEKDPNKPSRRAATNSYWSVEEKKRFRELVVQFGNDSKLIAAELKGKSERQVSNFFDAHREDMRSDELAKGGDEAVQELRKMNGVAEPPARPTFATPPPYARSIYDVFPAQRRSEVFEQRFAEPRSGMFPPSPLHPTPATDSKQPVSRPGGMRISASLNDEPATSGDSTPVRLPSISKSYDADAASDGTVSERDAEGGVKRPSPEPAPSPPPSYARVAAAAAFDAPRASEDYHRSSTAQPPFDPPERFYQPQRAATAAPAMPPHRASWDQARPHGEYPRDPYYHPASRSYPPPAHPGSPPITHQPQTHPSQSHPPHPPQPHLQPQPQAHPHPPPQPHRHEPEWRQSPGHPHGQPGLPPAHATGANGQRYEQPHPPAGSVPGPNGTHGPAHGH